VEDRLRLGAKGLGEHAGKCAWQLALKAALQRSRRMRRVSGVQLNAMYGRT
jgi:hypothetical protein